MALEPEHRNDLRVLVLPPTRRDGEATSALLEKARLNCAVCTGVRDLAFQIGHGVGAVLLTDAILSDPQAEVLLAALRAQPQWSDIPIVLLARGEPPAGHGARILGSLTNVTLLDRPASTRTLISAVQAALRTRTRQYQIRDYVSALRNAEEALRTADRRKDEFLAMLAHELRNPLSPIVTASELLERTLSLDATSKATLGIVKRQVKHLTRLVDDLLDVSRITQGRIQLHRRPLEVTSVVSQAMESVEPAFRQKHHNVILATSYKPLYVNGDSARLVQCVANVLTNAAKYTDPNGEIRLEVFERPPAVVIAVCDNGMGIPPELLPRIFDLFVQNDRSLDRSEGGLGVGLSVVKSLIEMHDGEVAVYSAGPGQGSRFELRLPLIDAPPPVGDESSASQVASKRILIVDDNIDAATCLAQLLAVEGHNVKTAYTPGEALVQASAFNPEVVLLDIGLPEMDGYTVAARLRDSGSKAVLVAVTGYGQIEDILRGRAAGFTGHLVKPVALDALNKLLGLEAC